MNIYATFGARGYAVIAVAIAVAVGVLIAGPAFGDHSVTAAVESDTLTIIGSSAGDEVAVRLAPGNPNTLQVDVGDGSPEREFDRSTFEAIDVFLDDGDDRFRVDRSNGSLDGESLVVTDGGGNDDVDL